MKLAVTLLTALSLTLSAYAQENPNDNQDNFFERYHLHDQYGNDRGEVNGDGVGGYRYRDEHGRDTGSVQENNFGDLYIYDENGNLIGRIDK